MLRVLKAPLGFLLLLAALEWSMQVDSEEFRPLQCIMFEKPELCKTAPVSVSTRLADLYLRLSNDSKKVFREGNLSAITDRQLLEIPLQILYLIPPQNLQKIPGEVLGALVVKYPDNPLILQKCVSAVSYSQRSLFLGKLRNVALSQDVLISLAQTLTSWNSTPRYWPLDYFQLLGQIGDPVLAYLPPDFLHKELKDVKVMYLAQLQQWKEENGMEYPMDDKPWAMRRSWSNLAVQSGYPSPLQQWSSDLVGYTYLMVGATPDELLRLEGEKLILNMINGMKLSKMQVRFLLRSLSDSTTATLESLKNVLHHMTPQDLLQFKNSSNFESVLSSLVGKSIPLATAKQMVELLKAHLVSDGKLADLRGETWGDNIQKFGRLAYALPNSELKKYHSKSLPLSVLYAVDSEELEEMQARYIIGTNNATTILQTKGLLRGLRTSDFVSLDPENLPQQFLHHVLSSLPSGSSEKSLAVLQKVRKHQSMDEMRAMLMNKNPNQFFGLLSSLEVLAVVKEIKLLFQTLKEETLKQRVKNLPPIFLSKILSVTRESLLKTGHQWSLEMFTSSADLDLAILGITCNDVAAMELEDLVPIITKFNKARKSQQKDFPKDLQYCLQTALLKYLAMKRELRQDNRTRGLLHYLEPFEINGIGGYVFANLPMSVIQNTDNLHLMIKAIGSLSVSEILLASSNTTPDRIAEVYINHLLKLNDRRLAIGAPELFTLGNLVFFLDIAAIKSIEPAAFKLFVECQNPADRVLCAGKSARDTWSNLIVSAFGSPSTWTDGTLAVLGDLLLALPTNLLDLISDYSWMYASDVLLEQTSYHIPIPWPGQTTERSYAKVCVKLLREADQMDYRKSVQKLVRRYLLATQRALDSIVPATQLLTDLQKSLRDVKEVTVSLGQPPQDSTTLYLENDTVNETTMGGEDTQEHVPTTSLVELLPFNTTAVPTTTTIFYKSGANFIEGIERELETHAPMAAFGQPLREHLAKQQRMTASINHLEEEPSGRSSQQEVTCDAIRAAGLCAAIGLEPSDINEMSSGEVQDCTETLGKLQLSPGIKEEFWRYMNKEKLAVSIETAGHLLTNVPVEAVEKLNFTLPSSLDILASLSSEVMDENVLRLIVHKFLLKNSVPSVWTTETVAALGQMMCKPARSYMDRSLGKDDVFIELSVLIGRTIGQDCPLSCLKDLARIAVKHTAYGPPERWTAEDVASLGVIFAGVKPEDLRHLTTNGSNNPLVGLQGTAVKCMPPQFFKSLTAEEISSLSPMAAAMMTHEQIAVLSEEQMSSLKAILSSAPGKELLEDLPKVSKTVEDVNKAQIVKMSVRLILLTILIGLWPLVLYDALSL